VIIPAFNREDVIERAVASVCRQSFTDLEIIVIDDGSTDNTEGIVRSIRDERIRYLRFRGNRGSAAARNEGLKVAGGKYVAFLDSDDEWLPAKIEKQVALMETLDDQWGICQTGAQIIADGLPKQPFIPRVIESGEVYRPLIFGKVPFLTPTLMFRKTILPQVGLFDERLRRGQDLEFLLRVFARCKMAVVSEPLAVVHLDTGKRLSHHVVRSRLLILEKHESEVRDRLGWYAARYFRASTYGLIAEANFRDGNLAAGVGYWLRAVSNVPFLPMRTHLLALAAISGALQVYKRYRKSAAPAAAAARQSC
jgi:glycosyltransferase involved in cell wall biosynthesis